MRTLPLPFPSRLAGLFCFYNGLHTEWLLALYDVVSIPSSGIVLFLPPRIAKWGIRDEGVLVIVSIPSSGIVLFLLPFWLCCRGLSLFLGWLFVSIPSSGIVLFLRNPLAGAVFELRGLPE